MEKYIEPVMEIILFDTEDVITTSGNSDEYIDLPDVPVG